MFDTNKLLSCTRCLKSFKHNWELRRHHSRKTKCKEPFEVFNRSTTTLERKITELDNEIQETKTELHETKQTICEINKKINQDIADSNVKCLFCNKLFKTSKNLRRHIKLCKTKIDNIAIYERELGIEVIDSEPLTCRYCSTTYTKQSNMSRHMGIGCRAKDKYELELQKQVIERRREASAQVINNNTHNGHINNTAITINMPKIEMNPFGQENLDYITTKLLIKELESCKAIQQADVSSIVNRFTTLIHANPAHPENQNVLFKSLNGGFARVYRRNGFQDEQATEIQDTIIQNVQKLIQTKGCDEYDYSNTKDGFADVLDDIDISYGKLGDELSEGNNTRALSKCRNIIKAALHSNKEEIENVQNLIENI